MPDALIILLLIVFAVGGIIAFFKLDNKNASNAACGSLLGFVILFVGFFGWLRVADANRATVVDWFFLHTVVCNDGTTMQVFTDGDEIRNGTQLLGKLYPDNGWVIERSILEPKNYGITFECLENEVSYRAIAPNEASNAN